MCIKVLAARSGATPTIGDVIRVSVKDAAPRGRVKKGEIYHAVVVRTRRREARRREPYSVRQQRGGAADRSWSPSHAHIRGR